MVNDKKYGIEEFKYFADNGYLNSKGKDAYIILLEEEK